VVVLRELEGLSYKEIADLLGITESAAAVRLHRARRQLRDILRGNG
jgi:RNA polymerase sigma factor (sigma-70 family)